MATSLRRPLVFFLTFLSLWSAVPALSSEPREILAQFVKHKKTFEAAARKGNLPEAVSAAKAIGDLDSSSGVKYLLQQAHVQPQDLYDAVVQAVPGSRSDSMKKLLLDMYRAELRPKSGNWVTRVMLLDVFRTMPSDEAVEVFSLAVKDLHPKVRLAAIRSLQDVSVAAEEKIPAWIEALVASEAARDVGTPHVEARSHLFKLTAKDCPDAAAWATYWKEHAATYAEPESEPTGDIAYDDAGEYYGDKVTSRRIVFIIDTSGSMNTFEHHGWPTAPNEPYGTGRTRSATSENGESVADNPRWLKWIQDNPLCVRLPRAQAELTRILDSLPADTYFNVIAFDSRVVPWQRELVPVQPASINGAKQFIASLRPSGATATEQALAMAFEKNHAADTIYFLSDGEPSTPSDPILMQVQAVNRFHRIIIHTYGIGNEGRAFMKSLAEQNSGRHKEIVGPPDWLEP